MHLSSTSTIIIGSLLNAAFMVLLSIFLLNQPVIHDDEKILIEKTADYKARYLGKMPKPSPDRFLFINVSHDKDIIPIPSELEGFDLGSEDFGDFDMSEDEDTMAVEFDMDFSMGTQAITHRGVLAQFFSILNKKPDNHTYIICDVIFEDPSDHDDELSQAMQNLPNLMIPFWQNEKNEVEYPLFDVPMGLATYTAVDDYFIKYRLMEDSLKTIPLLMYEQLHGTQLEKKNTLLYTMGDKFAFNNFILNLRIRNEDITGEESVYGDSYWKHLGATLSLNTEEEILEMTKDKIIVIGDFEDKENDYHKTLAGEMAGPLILLNTYLALAADDNIIHNGLYMILFIGFFMISLQVFHPKNIFDILATKVNGWVTNIATRSKKLEKKLPAAFWSFISKQINFVEQINGSVKSLFTYMGIFAVISTAAYLLLNNHINIFYLSLYVVFLENVIKYVKKLRDRSNAK